MRVGIHLSVPGRSSARASSDGGNCGDTRRCSGGHSLPRCSAFALHRCCPSLNQACMTESSPTQELAGGASCTASGGSTGRTAIWRRTCSERLLPPATLRAADAGQVRRAHAAALQFLRFLTAHPALSLPTHQPSQPAREESPEAAARSLPQGRSPPAPIPGCSACPTAAAPARRGGGDAREPSDWASKRDRPWTRLLALCTTTSHAPGRRPAGAGAARRRRGAAEGAPLLERRRRRPTSGGCARLLPQARRSNRMHTAPAHTMRRPSSCGTAT